MRYATSHTPAGLCIHANRGDAEMSSAAESGVDFDRIVAVFQASELFMSERRRDGRMQTLVLGEWASVCSILTTTSNYSGIVEGHGTSGVARRRICVLIS
jgi:hypothetical protein